MIRGGLSGVDPPDSAPCRTSTTIAVGSFGRLGRTVSFVATTTMKKIASSVCVSRAGFCRMVR